MQSRTVKRHKKKLPASPKEPRGEKTEYQIIFLFGVYYFALSQTETLAFFFDQYLPQDA